MCVFTRILLNFIRWQNTRTHTHNTFEIDSNKKQNVNCSFFICFHLHETKTKKKGFGLPPTPPSSLSSDDSEGNQSPEHSNSPMSPNVQQQLLQNQSQSASISPNSRRASTMQQNSHTHPSNGTGNTAPSSAASSRGYNGSSSRQPIHTPLISSQPVIYCVPYSVQICTSCILFTPVSTIHVVMMPFCGTPTISNYFFSCSLYCSVSLQLIVFAYCAFSIFTERINGAVGINGGGEAHIDSRRLSHSCQTSIDQNRRKIIEKNSPKNQEQSEFFFSNALNI